MFLCAKQGRVWFLWLRWLKCGLLLKVIILPSLQSSCFPHDLCTHAVCRMRKMIWFSTNLNKHDCHSCGCAYSLKAEDRAQGADAQVPLGTYSCTYADLSQLWNFTVGVVVGCSTLRLSNSVCVDSWTEINWALAMWGLEGSAKLKSEFSLSDVAAYNLS